MNITHWFFLVLVTALVSCEAPTRQRQVAFNEADFRWAGGTGTGSVVGQGYVKMNSGKIRYVENTSMALTPVNTYTSESIQRRYINGENLTPSDARLQKYARSVPTDSRGRFAFDHLPPGEYYIGSSVDWKDVSYNADPAGILVPTYYEYAIPIYARITVKNGQTVRVTNWETGKQRQF